MTLFDLTPFEAELTARGYKRERNAMVLTSNEVRWWKGIWTKDREYRDYTVAFSVYDRSGYPDYDVERFGRWGVEYRMTVNHQTQVDVELATLDVLHDSMTVEEWERRCAVVFFGLKDAFGAKPRMNADKGDERG